MRTLLLLSLLAGLVVAQEDVVFVELRSEASVQGTRLRLGDLASIRGTSETAARRVARLTVGRPAADGSPRLLRRDTLEGLVEREGPPGIHVAWSGAENVQVIPELAELPVSQIDTLVRRHLLEILGPRAAHTRILEVRAHDELRTVAGRWQTAFDVRRTDPDAVLSGLVELEAVATVDGREGARVPVKVVIEAERPVLVAKKDLLPNRPILAEDLELVIRRVDGRGAPPLDAIEAAVGKLPRARLVKGAPISASLLRSPPCLRKGDRLIVEVRTGALTITTSGQALEDGAPGDRIRIHTGKRRKTTFARVLDSQRVRVESGTERNAR